MKRAPARRKRKSRSKTTINRSVRKKLYRLGLVSVVFLVSFLFLFSYSFYKYLNQRFASALSSTSYSILEDSMPTVSYIVAEDLSADPIIIKKVNFIIFNKENKKVSIFNMPVDVNYEIPGKFGSEVFAKTFALGGMNSDDAHLSGADAINRSLFKIFGFKVDKFMLTDSAHEKFFDELWHEGGVLNLVSLKNVTSLGNSLKTDMDLREFYGLLSFVYSLPKERIVDEDFSPVNFNDTSKFDDYIREYTYESSLAEEQKNISVLNGTGYPGLASFGSRVITNYGGRVIATQNSSDNYDVSYIIADDVNSQSVAFLSRVFRIDNILSKEESYSIFENVIDRSDVVVIFGFDTLGDLY
jgi:hypothetical protein